MADTTTAPHAAPIRRRLLGIVTGTLLAVVTLLAVLMVGIPFALGAQSYTVLTGSMRPGLQPGALIAVRPTAFEDIRVGDVVTYQVRSGEPEVVTHRVVGETEANDGSRLLILRGDANDVADPEPVQAVQVRGVVVYALPWLGYINVWATPWTKSLLVTVLGGGAIIYGVVTLIRGGARRRATAATVVVAAVMLSGFVPPAPAMAATGGVQLSADGTTWVSAGAIDVFRATEAVIVPGETIQRAVWIRNAADVPAALGLAAEWRPSDPARPPDVALAAALAAEIDAGAPGDGRSLAPGEAVRVPVAAVLPLAAGNDVRTGMATLVVSATLTEVVAEDLAVTGTAIDPRLLGAGLLAAAAGVLLLVRWRRTKGVVPRS